MVHEIEVKEFSNELALEMGIAIIKLAKSRNQKIAVEIRRLNHTVFLFVDDGLAADKHVWLKRKSNVAIFFEMSSLSVRKTLEEKNRTLKDSYGLDEKDYAASGGSIPIFVENVGMVGTITVSALKDFEDHQLILDALTDTFI